MVYIETQWNVLLNFDSSNVFKKQKKTNGIYGNQNEKFY